MKHTGGIKMGYVVFFLALVLEKAPIEGYNWDFGYFWIPLFLILLAQVSVQVTFAQNARD